MNVFELSSTLALDAKGFYSGLEAAAGKAKSFASTVGSGLATAAKMGGAAISAASTAAAGFGTSAVKTGMAFDSSMAQVAATMGKTVDEIQDLRDFAKEMGAETVFSATQSADALNYMALAGYDASESMEMLPNVLNLAASGAMDLARASDMVTDAQSALGLSAEQTKTMVDQMAKAASTTNTSVSQLGEAMLTIGATAKNMKGGTAELSQVLGLLADNGIKGAEGGTKLRNMITKLISPTKDGAAVLNAFGVSLYDAEGNMRSMQDVFADLNAAMSGFTQEQKDKAMSDLFNTRDLAAVNALLNTSTERWNEVATAIGNAEGAAQQMADTQLDNLAGDVTILKSAYEGLQIAVSDALTNGIRPFVQEGTDMISQLTEAANEGGFEGLIDKASELIPEILNTINNKIPDLVEMGDKIISGIVDGIEKNLKDAKDVATKIVKTLTDSLSRNLSKLTKIGLDIVGAIAKAIGDNSKSIATGASKLITTLADGIKKNLPTVIKAAQALIKDLVSEFSKHTDEWLNAGQEIIDALIDGLVDTAETQSEPVMGIITKIANFLVENLEPIANAAIKIITSLANGLGEHIDELIPTITQAVMDIADMLTKPETLDSIIDAALKIIEALGQGLVDSLPILLERLPTIIEQAATTLINNMPKILEAALKLITTLADGILENLPILMEKLPGMIERIVSEIIKNLPKLLDAAIAFVTKLGDLILENLPTLLEKLPTMITDIVTRLVELAPDLITAAVEMVGQLAKGIFDNLGKIFEKGPEIIDSLISGIMSAFGSLFNIGGEGDESIVGKILSGIGHVFQSIIDIGGKIVGWVIDGIKSLFTSLFNIGGGSGEDNIVGKILAGIGHVFQSIIDIGGKIVGWVIDGIKSLFTSLFNIGGTGDDSIVGKLLSGIGGALSGFFSIGVEIVQNVINGIFSMAEPLLAALRDILPKPKDLLNLGASIASGGERPEWIDQPLTDVIGNLGNSTSSSSSNSYLDTIEKMNKNKKSYSSLGIMDDVKKIGSSLETSYNNFINDIKGGKFVPGDGGMKKAGSSIVENMWQGINDSSGWFNDKFGSWLGGIEDEATDFFGIHSPSTEMAWIGRMLVEGLAEGITDREDDAVRTMGTLCENIIDSADVLSEEIGGTMTEMGNSMIDAIEGQHKDVYDAGEGLMTEFVKGLEAGTSGITKVMSGVVGSLGKETSGAKTGSGWRPSSGETKSTFSASSMTDEQKKFITDAINAMLYDAEESAKRVKRGMSKAQLQNLYTTTKRNLTDAMEWSDFIGIDVSNKYNDIINKFKSTPTNLGQKLKNYVEGSLKWDEPTAEGFKAQLDNMMGKGELGDVVGKYFRDMIERYKTATGGTNITNNITINSPKALDPAEVARRTTNAMRGAALSQRGL